MQHMRQPFRAWSEGAYATEPEARAVAPCDGAGEGRKQVSRHGR
jgi:hypothetical protein